MLSYKFAEFTLNPASRKLFRNGEELVTRDRDFDVLLILIEKKPQILSKDKIIETVWNGIAVEDNSVERSLVNIRKILGDSASNPHFIKTVRGKGYLFIGQIEALSNDNVQTFSRPKPAQNYLASGLSLPVLFISLLLVFFVLILGNGFDFYRNLTGRTVFYDDFSGKEIDSKKWILNGKSVRLSDGVVKISVDEIDGGGKLQSVSLKIDPQLPLTIKSRLKVSFNQSVQSNVNFVGNFGLVFQGSQSNNFYGLRYANAEGEFCYTGNNLKAEGFYLVKNNGDVRLNRHHNDGRIGPQVEAVWDQWFEQKLVYEPQKETLSLFINDEKKAEFVIGKLPFDEENQITLEIYPQGWWLHHSFEIDEIFITQ